ncbi:hypothetical protein [Phaeovulum sp. W22_SRMD_FR3]|uniref:hypothetical protein n=1 Tax=Phaeovulum sp. W22_SRMD_FR3 TaxID=3240274 RepID=UPI003F9C0BA8
MTRMLAGVNGLGLMCVTVGMILVEWGAGAAVSRVLPYLTLALLIVLTPQVRRGRQCFVVVGVALTVALAFQTADWGRYALAGLQKAAFIGAFFCALASLRSVAQRSTAIQEAGRFLARQPPGRRYLALTFGGQMFALVLNYGAIALLGGLARASAGTEQNAEIRQHRRRRMLLAIQRGFASTLPWSPLSFAIAITTALIPGTSWATVALPGMITSVLMAGTGWALDTIFKPKLSVPAPSRQRPEGSWLLMSPLIILLGVILGSVAVLYLLTGIHVVGLVILIVPVVAALWAILQGRPDVSGTPGLPGIRSWLKGYVFTELPEVKGEVVLLMMAGYIGTLGAALLGPVLATFGVDLSLLPTPVFLVLCVWLIPLAGQIGMNPILAVTLMAPLIPSAETLGVAPTAIVVAIAAGWALSGVTSPFTATTLLVGSFGEVSARHVGVVWNRGYFLTTAVILSIWVLCYAQF